MITSFNGKYEILSLKFPFQYTLYNISYNNLEEYYFSFKCSQYEHMKEVAASPNPEAKIIEINLQRSDWKDVRRYILQHGIYMKFSMEPYATALRDTKDEELIYGFNIPNPSEDLLFLGKSLITGEGQNTLGILLMEQRYYNNNLRAHEEIQQYGTYTST